MKSNLFILFLLMSIGMRVVAAEWQWSVTVDGSYSKEVKGEAKAFLWIPPTCGKLNAVVFSQQNMTEETLFRSSLFRKEMERLGIGIIWIAPGISQDWNPSSNIQAVFSCCLKDLATVSGYDELTTVPIVPFGHSAMATFPWNFAAWNSSRTLCIISYHGDAPRTNLCGYGRENVEWGRTRNIDRVPGLMIEGEFEWWEARVNPALAFRMMYPESRISFLCDAGRGHFDLYDETIKYMVSFIEKSLKEYPKRGSVTDEGWLVHRWNGDGKRPSPAPAREYKGDKHDSFWYFDREMAEWTERRYTETRRKCEQYVSFTQNGSLIPYNPKTHVKLQPKFIPEEDGVTFYFAAVNVDSLSCRLSTKHAIGKPRIRCISGPVKQLNDTTFRLNFYCTGFTNPGRWGICLAAEMNGDSKYKSAVRELTVHIPMCQSKGKRQSILFPSLQDMQAEKGKRIRMQATADSGLPVYYYIKEGAAVMDGDELVLTQIPPRAKMPMKVTVGAWQYGVKDKVQTAEPVERSFYIY